MNKKLININADKRRDDMCKKMVATAEAMVRASAAVNGPLEVTPVDKAEHWARLIRQSLRRSVEALLEAGKHLLAARKDLDRGQWTKLFDQGLIPLNEREAQRLMQVARHPVLSKANSCSLLPPSPQALAALAKSDPEALEQALGSQQISPRTTIIEAISFQRKHPAAGAKKRRAGTQREYDPDRSLTRCRNVLWSEMEKCPNDALGLLVSGVEDILQQMKEAARDIQHGQDLASAKPVSSAGSSNT